MISHPPSLPPASSTAALSLCLALAAFCGRNGVAEPQAGLVLAYAMTEGQGEGLSDSVAGHDATVTNGEWVRNRDRAALRFDGRTTFARLDDSAGVPLTAGFSVALWYRAQSSMEPVALVVKPPTFRLLLYPQSRKLLVEVTGAAGKRVYASFEAPIRLAAWQHVALTCSPDGGTHLFLDGQEAFHDGADLGPLAPASGAMRIGLGVDPTQRRYFRGLMAGFRLWNRALAQKEIAQLMADENPALQSTFRGPADVTPKLPPAEPLDVGSRKQLFIDERFVEAKRSVELRMNPPQKLGPVLLPEKPWELGMGFCASVIEDGGTLKLFYRCEPPAGGANVCLATSTDGVHWERPSLGLIEYAGSKDNNIVFSGVGEAVVFLDPHGKPEQRYKMIVMLYWPDGAKAGLYCHTSPDGLRWTPGPRVLDIAPDTANQAAWDAQRGKYVAYVRKWDPLRKFGRIEMDDVLQPWPYERLGENAYFIWGKDKIPVPSKEMPTAFGYDEVDPIESDHYNPAVVEYPWAQSAYFSFPSPYLHFPPPPAGKYHNDGLLDIQMAVSRDGVEFHRLSREPYVPLSLEGQPDSKSLYMAVGMLRVGDSLFQYYGGYAATHGEHDEVRKAGKPHGSFCAVKQRLDGFVSADAAYTGGELLSPPLTFTGDRLVLNVDTSAMGCCQVGLLDADGDAVEGFGSDVCDEIHGNYLGKVVSWGGKTDVSAFAGKPVRLHFAMRAAKLYAFQFEGG
jgi:hypothetical protein